MVEKSNLLLEQDEASFYESAALDDAYRWVRARVAPEATREKFRSASETYISELTETLSKRVDMDRAYPFARADYPGPGIFRTYSTFEPKTGIRRSADTLLDRENRNLTIWTGKNVDQILFDGDLGIPLVARAASGSIRIGSGSWLNELNSRKRARCVRFSDWSTACTKKNGRIYLAAGALHSPKILIKSGIGKDGAVINNPEVGENLSDKPGIHQLANFRKGFDNAGQVTYNHVASSVTKMLEATGEQRTQLFEEGSVGNPTLMNLLAFFRALLPT